MQGCRRSSEAEWQKLHSEARLQFERGNLSDALKKTKKGFDDSLKNPAWNWKFRVAEAEVLVWQGKGNDALNLLSVPPPPELAKGEFAVRAKDTQGFALLILGRFAEAAIHFSQAEVLASQTAPYMLCKVFLDEGTFALNARQYTKAEERFRQALQLSREHRNTFVESSALGSLGLISTNTGRFDEAIEWLTKSLVLARASQYRLIEYISVMNYGWSYQQLGDSEKAIEQFKEEEKVIDDLGQDQLKVNMFRSMGDAYFTKRNYAAARTRYLTAFHIAEKMQRETHSREELAMAAALSNVAEVDLREGKLQQAEENNRQALMLRPKFPRAILNSARIAAARSDLEQASSLLQDVIETRDTEELVRWQAKTELANIYAARGEDNLAQRQFENVIDDFNGTLTSIRQLENKLAFSLWAERFYDDYINFLLSRGQDDKALQVAEFSRARTLAERVGIQAPKHPADISIPGIRNFFRQQKKVSFAYWLAPDKSYLWVILASGKVSLFTLPSEDKIETAVRDYQDILQGPQDQETLKRKGSALYDMLVAPAQKLISAGSEIVIVPDGALYALNFETLLVPGPQAHYWIEDVEVENASSMLLLAKRHDHAPRKLQKLLLVGNPVEASSDYPALRHAAEEISVVNSLFLDVGTKVVSQQAAVPSSYHASHPEQFDLIHFVTHGTASEISPLESAIILSPEGEHTFKLYAREVVNIPIKADVVTISACYGAGKRTYSKEGLVGLAWAFLAAGAHRVVAGLWEVDDQAMPQLMNNFYAGLRSGQTPAKALRSAKLAMLRSNGNHAHPYYWASLQLYAGAQ